MQQKNIIQMKKVTKQFGSFFANKDINITIKEGSIHALIGENGAGKSTLMNQLFGLIKPTSGQIYIREQKVNIESPNDANELGLSMVHQHFQLVENHTVIENIILGDEKAKILQPIDFQKAKLKLLAISEKYQLKINPNLLVKKASVGMQQRIEILKMLYREAEILIFDEPTAMLTPQEIEGLLQLFLDLKKQGKTIILISHKLDEIKAVADFATVIRKGEAIETFAVANKTIDQMAQMMVGRKLIEVKNKVTSTETKASIVKINNLTVKHSVNKKALGLKNFSLEIKAGEILAIAGVEGNGQLELVNALFGLTRMSSGKIEILSKLKNQDKQFVALKNGNVLNRYHHQFSFVPEDRYKYAMLENENLFANVILQTFRQKPYSIFGFLQRKPRLKWTQEVIKEFDVRGNKNGYAKIGELSGGNQQKFIIGREMSRTHKLLILFQPTRGLDIGAIEFIHQKMLEEKEKGNAILLVSYDLNEVMALADRIAVVNQGNLIKVTQMKNLKRETIGKWMAGIK